MLESTLAPELLREARTLLAAAIEEWPHQNGDRLYALLKVLRLLSASLDELGK
jgi:hypothetical protein